MPNGVDNIMLNNCFITYAEYALFSTAKSMHFVFYKKCCTPHFSGRVGGKILKIVKRRNAIYNTAYIFLYLGSKYYYFLFLVIVHSALSATMHSMQPYRFTNVALYAIILQGNQDSSKRHSFPLPTAFRESSLRAK